MIKAKYFVVEPYYMDGSILSEIVYLDMLDNISEILYHPLSMQLFKNKLIRDYSNNRCVFIICFL
jgi:hypothetical protein